MIYSIHLRPTWVPTTLLKWCLSSLVAMGASAHATTSDLKQVHQTNHRTERTQQEEANLDAEPAHSPKNETTTENAQKSVPKKTGKREVTILPLITFYDVSKDATYNWWSEQDSESEDAKKHSKHLMAMLGKENGKLVHFLDPYKNRVKFRKNLQKTSLTLEEMLAVATDLKTEVLMVGDVVVDKSTVVPGGYRLKIRLELLRAPAFNKVGEVYRVAEYYPVDYLRLVETGGDIWLEAREAIEKRVEEYRPTANTRLELIVNGSFDHHQLAQFQRHLKNQIANIKDISQSFLERDTFGIFVEYAGRGGEDLSRELKDTRIEGFMTQVVSSTNSQVIFDVRPQSAVK